MGVSPVILMRSRLEAVHPVSEPTWQLGKPGPSEKT